MPRRKKILVVEDEDAIRRGVCDALRVAGYEPVEAADGEIGLLEARRAGVDLVLLDLMLPRIDGVQVLDELRQTNPSLPVIILSARGAEDDRISGLRKGADDYVVKPFSVKELLARVESVLRRSPERVEPTMTISNGKVLIDCARREIIKNDETQSTMSEMESAIVSRLAAHAGRAVAREELLSAVWGIRDGHVETRAIDMHITRLRSKIASTLEENDDDWIVTVRGKGYMLNSNLDVEKKSSDEDVAVQQNN